MRVSPRAIAVVNAAVLSVSAGLFLWRSPHSASDLEIVPDSVEYACAAHRIVTHGTYDIVIEGKSYPPRYAPWFSLLVLAPAYAIAGPEPGNAIWPILLFGIAGVAAAWGIGHRISGPWGGLFAALLVVTLPLYRFYHSSVMTDGPCAALLLGACWLFLHLALSPSPRRFAFVFAGLLIALTTALRFEYAAAALPFLWLAWRQVKRWPGLLAVVIPLGIVVAATAIYNAVTFGSPLRSGYQYWCPVPYDYPNLTFSGRYILPNLRAAAASGLPWAAAAFAVGVLLTLSRHARTHADPASGKAVGPACLFFLLTTAPGAVFHLVYFFPDARFFLPVVVGALLIAGALLGGAARALSPALTLPVSCACLALAVSARLLGPPDIAPYRRLSVERAAASAPPGSLVISAIDPVYFDFILAGRSRPRWMALDRHVEYASKLAAPKRIPNPVPPPANGRDHRCAGLRNGGAVEVIPLTAQENPEAIAAELAAGTRVFLDTCGISCESIPAVEGLMRRFAASPRKDNFFELALPAGANRALP